MLIIPEPVKIHETLNQLANQYRANAKKAFDENGLFHFRQMRPNAPEQLTQILTELNKCEFIFDFHFTPKNDTNLQKKGHLEQRLSGFAPDFSEISKLTQPGANHYLHFDQGFLGRPPYRTYYFEVKPDGGTWIPGITKFAKEIHQALQKNTAIEFNTTTRKQDWSIEGTCLQATDIVLGAVGSYIKNGTDRTSYDLISEKL